MSLLFGFSFLNSKMRDETRYGSQTSASKSPGGLVKPQSAGPHPQSLWFTGSRMHLRNLHVQRDLGWWRWYSRSKDHTLRTTRPESQWLANPLDWSSKPLRKLAKEIQMSWAQTSWTRIFISGTGGFIFQKSFPDDPYNGQNLGPNRTR